MISFNDIYDRYSRDVRRFAFWLSGNAADADDITAETFARAWAGADGLRAATVKAYLLTIARNLFLESRRKRRETVELSPELPDPEADPETATADRRRLQRVLEGLQQLSEIDRAALLLRTREGLTYSDIARALGLSVSAAKVKVHRARLRLANLERPGSSGIASPKLKHRKRSRS